MSMFKLVTTSWHTPSSRYLPMPSPEKAYKLQDTLQEDSLLDSQHIIH